MNSKHRLQRMRCRRDSFVPISGEAIDEYRRTLGLLDGPDHLAAKHDLLRTMPDLNWRGNDLHGPAVCSEYIFHSPLRRPGTDVQSRAAPCKHQFKSRDFRRV
jgi:hypothetical protein